MTLLAIPAETRNPWMLNSAAFMIVAFAGRVRPERAGRCMSTCNTDSEPAVCLKAHPQRSCQRRRRS